VKASIFQDVERIHTLSCMTLVRRGFTTFQRVEKTQGALMIVALAVTSGKKAFPMEMIARRVFRSGRVDIPVWKE